MLKPLTQAIAQLLPGEAGQELKKNIDAVVQSHFEQMNLVTRDHLEVQEKILKRTRQRIAQLEKRIEELENRLTKE